MKFKYRIVSFVLPCSIALVLSWLYLGFLEKPLLINPRGFSQIAYDDAGQVIRITLASDERYRLWLPLDRISPSLVAATLQKEDKHFYSHPGINPVSLVRAALATYVTGERRIGGSTISMQLARMRFGINSQSIKGKLDQIFHALLLERHFTKKEILEAYLNFAPYGGNIEGIGAASLVFFGKSAAELSMAEAISVTVIPQSPSRRNPLKKSNYGSLKKARLSLLRNWRKEISAEHPRWKQLEAAETEFELPMTISGRDELPKLAPHLLEKLVRDHRDNLEIKSTINSSLQRLLTERVKHYVARKTKSGIYNSCAILVDHRNMELKALVGSADYFNSGIHGAVDGTRALRSPGSTLKPLIYALAIDQGIIHPQSILKDSPLSLAAYTPENFDSDFLGPLTVHKALIRSRNVPAIRLSARIDNPDLYSLLEKAGVRKLQSKSHYGLALALGGVEVSMHDLVRLYAMLANGGVFQDIITTKTNNNTSRSSQQMLSPEASRLVLDILEDSPRPGATVETSWLNKPQKVAWKTGTSWGFRDAWTIGVFGQYVLAVWVGNFDGQSNPEFVGRKTAAPLFFEIVDAISNDNKFTQDYFKPHKYNIKKVKICSRSGMLPNKHCKHINETSFIPGVSPITRCNVHREISVDNNSGLRLCHQSEEYFEQSEIRKAVYEFWPSDLLHIFRTAGLAHKNPPTFSKSCQTTANLNNTLAPKIISPERHVEYNLRSIQKAEKLPFTAVTDGDNNKVFWFVDESYVGTARSGEAFFWDPRPGNYVVRVVDQFGRHSARELRVVLVD